MTAFDDARPAAATHFPGGPSAAARRIQCPLSVTLEQHYPDDGDSPAARDGVAWHWACAEQLAGRLVAVGQIAPNGVVLDDDMVDAADMVLDDVTLTLRPFGLLPRDGVSETRVQIDRVYPGMFGTPDYYVWVPGRPAKLFKWEFKYGHRYVEVFELPQSVDYIAGICGHTNDVEYPVDVEVRLIQPRAFHRDGPIRSWKTTLIDLRGLINISSNAAHEAFGPNPRARVGPECRDCRARHACGAFSAAVYDALHEATRSTPLALTPAAMSVERKLVLDAIAVLEARKSGLDAQIEHTIKAGGSVPGWRLEHGHGRERWTEPAAAIIAMGQMFGLDLAKPPAALTPKQACAAGLDPSVAAALSVRPRSAATLVEDEGIKWRKVFGGQQ